MTFIVITILIGCLSTMAVYGRRGPWPPGTPAARPRLVVAGGTYEGSQGRPSDVYVLQERLIAVADGGGATRFGHTAAALTLGAVVVARPQYTARREQDMEDCVQEAHRAVRTTALRNPAVSGLISTLDMVVLDPGENPFLRYAHVGNGAIWHCPKGGRPRSLTTPHSFEGGPPLRAIGLESDLASDLGTVPLHPGDRVAIVTDGVIRAVGAARLAEFFSRGASPAACLDGLYDELAAAEPKDDATVVIADFVTV
ncbi:PP2C family protein-serine/threonine phosphatase [Planobispora longispora]|uniref:PPM-type phosphatase domain-containing protein n=1 Tax=Planobispora longispora TaxID=28887 RepID=A0A8J3RI80_9ACTN|nr:protein phosphatase 2C domain-containing protein [Planobispora longispora]BFE79980.1 hypothetical protein GCM10020093_025810 [Planobispora longispora]GIH76871.1 hypothetical protein Plo01_33000 [Planobispora longispora]